MLAYINELITFLLLCNAYNYVQPTWVDKTRQIHTKQDQRAAYTFSQKLNKALWPLKNWLLFYLFFMNLTPYLIPDAKECVAQHKFHLTDTVAFGLSVAFVNWRPLQQEGKAETPAETGERLQRQQHRVYVADNSKHRRSEATVPDELNTYYARFDLFNK